MKHSHKINMTISRLVAGFLFLLAGSFHVYSQESGTYFTIDEMPDLVKILPAPPDTTGADFTYDILRYFWGKSQRQDKARARIVDHDAQWDLDSLFVTYNVPFGLTISKETTPEIHNLLTKSINTIQLIRIRPKAHYMRKRPFDRFNEHMLTEWEEEDLRGNGSYPSGHTIRGWSTALLLSEINPDAADAILARGWMYGDSRIIAGAHWQSDVDAGRHGASIAYAKLQTSPEFREDMERAKEEFRRLKNVPEAKPIAKTLAPEEDSRGFVNITDVVPDAILEIRYFSTYNLIGDRIDGYLEPTALLTKEAALALKAVSDDLKEQGYIIKIFDAYRPQCAVDHFVRWAADISDTRMKQYFYPDIDKSVLFEQEYIMEKSGHTRGSTIDLTLFDMNTEKEVDMGGTFDWFGSESHPDFGGNPDTGKYKCTRGITKKQFRNRMILRNAMVAHGFKTLDSEWWHFTLANEPYPDTYFTFPVKKLDN